MKYIVSGTVTISIYTEVEAETEENAIQIAEERSLMQIPMSSESANEVWMAGELDGTPQNITAEPDLN